MMEELDYDKLGEAVAKHLNKDCPFDVNERKVLHELAQHVDHKHIPLLAKILKQLDAVVDKIGMAIVITIVVGALAAALSTGLGKWLPK